MTLYMLFDAIEDGKLSLKDRLKVSAHASRQQPSKLVLRPVETIRGEDAIRALGNKSANDVAVVIAGALGGPVAKFTRRVPARAHLLGTRVPTYPPHSGPPTNTEHR